MTPAMLDRECEKKLKHFRSTVGFQNVQIFRLSLETFGATDLFGCFAGSNSQSTSSHGSIRDNP